uniref:Solute carrier family 36 member 3 n=1 Tax=Molossus molossus TaxID=27622 RepID=A0A7J8ID42_MOLMO|nr:solute carrier family 36 member 3 [Molossus molossus]
MDARTGGRFPSPLTAGVPRRCCRLVPDRGNRGQQGTEPGPTSGYQDLQSNGALFLPVTLFTLPYSTKG